MHSIINERLLPKQSLDPTGRVTPLRVNRPLVSNRTCKRKRTNNRTKLNEGERTQGCLV